MRSPNRSKILHVLALVAAAALARPRAVAAADPDETPNACGCYKTGAGNCYCDRKAKCGCPGECEPKGCEEKRAKQLEKEIREETRKAEQHGRVKESSEDDEAPPARAGAGAKAKEETAARPKLTAAQRKELGRLIDAYLVEHPEAGRKTLDETRQELGQSPRKP
jgi:hypothetical protein